MREAERSFWNWVWPPPPIARRLWLMVVASTAYALVVWAVHPEEYAAIPTWTAPLAAVNTAILSLLVSFRTKVAYDRWWEGRILWGNLVNHSRNLCLKGRELAKLDAGERAVFAKMVSAFPVALAEHLRETPKPAGVLTPIQAADAVIATVAGWRAANRIDGHMHQILDAHLSAFMDVAGACERIRNTPLPPSYLSLLRHGLVLGFLLTPWAVAQALGAWMLPLQAVVVYFLFGIELTAEAVEQPFGSDGDDLPLEKYCETIRASAADILRE